jgi:[protein-PII] uridylyltransferase
MPERYLLGVDSHSLCLHAEVAGQAQGGLLFGASVFGEVEGCLEIVIGCPDRPGLLADFTAALAAHRFSVDAAQLYTRKRLDAPDEAFDLFYVSHPNLGAADLLELELARLRRTLSELVAGRTTADALLKQRSRPPSWARTGPRIKTEIHVDNSSSPDYTVVDIYTRDRPDLLHLIARALHAEGLSIALAKVNTEGARVADVFYVQAADGGQLSGEGRLQALSTTLRQTIRKLD